MTEKIVTCTDENCNGGEDCPINQQAETWRIEDDHIIEQNGDVIVAIDDLCPDFPDAVKLVIAERIVAVMNFCQDADYADLFTGGLRGVLTEVAQIREVNARLLKANQQLAAQLENVPASVVIGDRIYNEFCGHGEVVKITSVMGRICWDNGKPGDWYPLDMIAKARIKP